MEYIKCYKSPCSCNKLHTVPKFEVVCKSGSDCPNMNCWFSHPHGWKPVRKYPDREFVPCVYKGKCTRASCEYLHPEHAIEVFETHLPRPCKFGTNCKDIKCTKLGHDSPPAMCRYGKECRTSGMQEPGGCKWSHTLIPQACPHGIKCTRGGKCWYAIHPARCAQAVEADVEEDVHDAAGSMSAYGDDNIQYDSTYSPIFG